MRRKILICIALTIVGVAVAPSPANAATGGTHGAHADTEAAPTVPVEQLPGDDLGNNVGIFAVAPSCIHLDQWTYKSVVHAQSTNWCGYVVRYRFIWAWASDGLCLTIPIGGGWEEDRGTGGPLPDPYVSELRLC